MSVYLNNLPLLPTASEIIGAARKHKEERLALVNYIVQTVRPSQARFNNVLLPLVELENEHAGAQSLIAALRHVSPHEEIRVAVEEAHNILSLYWAEEEQRQDLFLLIREIAQRDEPLDKESKRLLRKKLRAYSRNGFEAPTEETKVAFINAKRRINTICAKFNQTASLGESGFIRCTEKELHGIPRQEVVQWKLQPDSAIAVPLTPRAYRTVMTYSHCAETRKRMLAAWHQRFPENISRFKEVIILRDRTSRWLGYANHATFLLPDRLLNSTDEIIGLLEFVGGSITPMRQSTLQRLQYKRKQIGTIKTSDNLPEEPLESWDLDYLRRLLDEDTGGTSAALEYFPLKYTVEAILKRLTGFLSLRLEQVPAEALHSRIWAHDVSIWSVWDDRPESTGAHMGYLYVDVLERPGKSRQARTLSLQPGYSSRDGYQVRPVTLLSGSFVPLVVDGCQLLTHDHIVTLYHEMGHVLHDLLATTKYSRFHGGKVCVELGEAIGTMMENWAWMKNELQAISCHYTYLDIEYSQAWLRRGAGSRAPEKRIPDDLAAGLVESRNEKRVESCLSQICDALFDIAIHSPHKHDDLQRLDEIRLYKDIKHAYQFFRSPEPCYLHTSLVHLMSGYNTGYYAYVCANVIAEDLFEQTFLNDPENTAAWTRFRHGILQYGGSRDENQMLESYLGRRPSPMALIRSLGVKPVSKGVP